jgi:hypothetical protein
MILTGPRGSESTLSDPTSGSNQSFDIGRGNPPSLLVALDLRIESGKLLSIQSVYQSIRDELYVEFCPIMVTGSSRIVRLN